MHVHWDFATDDTFLLTWRENGGPLVHSPNRQGYGQKTLHRSIASAIDGKVTIDYQSEGFVCRVTAPQSHGWGKAQLSLFFVSSNVRFGSKAATG